MDSSVSPQVKPLRYDSAATSVAGASCPRCGYNLDNPGVGGGAPPTSSVPVPVAADPEPVRAAVVAVLRAILEMVAGRRPTGLAAAAVAEPQVLRYVRATLAVQGPGPVPRVRRVLLGRPAAAAVETAAVVALGGRVRAVAARFEERDRGWCCVVLRIL